MARLVTCGFEFADRAAEGADDLGGAWHTSAGSARSGGRGCSWSNTNNMAQFAFAGVLGRTYYVREYIFLTNQSFWSGRFFATTALFAWNVGGALLAGVDLEWSGTAASPTLTLMAGGSSRGVSSVLSFGRWYRVEMKITIGTGAVDAVDARIDGVSIGSASGLSLSDTALSHLLCCANPITSVGFTLVNHDDVALNDDQGTSQNTWPGDGAIYALLPTADSARGANWTAGAGGTTNLFDAVDNEPPVGIAAAAATNTSQIKNAAKDTSGLYDATMQSYSAVGIGAYDTVSLVQGLLMGGPGGATAMTQGIQVASNPVIAETTAASPPNAVGTHPSNWVLTRTAVSYAPAVTKGTAPVARVRKGTSSTTALNVDLVAMLVEVVPGQGPARPVSVCSQAVKRASLWMKRHLRAGVPWLWTPAARAVGART